MPAIHNAAFELKAEPISDNEITLEYRESYKGPPIELDIEAAKYENGIVEKSSQSSNVKLLLTKYKKPLILCLKSVFLAGWLTYIGFALYRNFDDSLPLLIITALGFVFKGWTILKNLLKHRTPIEFLKRLVRRNSLKCKLLMLFCGLAVAITGITITLMEEGVDEVQWISLAGYFIIPLTFYVFSASRSDIVWQPVIGGLMLQVLFGLLVLKTKVGLTFFEYLSDSAKVLLDCVEAGSAFVFGDTYMDHRFAFKTLPIIVYVSAIVSILYYVGAMQWIIMKIGWVMYVLLGTSATESMVAAGNIFIGQTESPLLIRPYLPDCTDSELLAIMAAGMATIAGSVLGAFLGYGANGVFLMTGSVMAAPTVLALSKLVYPERQTSKFRDFSKMRMEADGDVKSVIEAALKGASEAIPLVANIAAVLIAFLAILELGDVILGALGELVGIEALTIQQIFSYIFWPLTYILGVEFQDVTLASRFIGTKIIANEFIAYGELQTMQGRRQQGCERATEGDNLGWIGLRSEAIVTYALCGFANLSSTGIVLGGLSGLAPNKRSTMARLIFLALAVGALVSCHNAALSGFLLNESYLLNDESNVQVFNGTTYNCTKVAQFYANANCQFTYSDLQPVNTCKLDQSISDQCYSSNSTEFESWGCPYNTTINI